MDINSGARRVADNVSAAIAAHPATLATVAHAADIDQDDLSARLHGGAALTVNDLIRVGGFLRIRPARFMEGAAA